MFSVHIPTVFAFTAPLSAFLGGLLIWLWWRDRSQPALASWGVARLLGGAALPLLVARGSIPDWVSIDFGNTVICLAYGLIWCGARQFEGRRVRLAAILAGAVLWLVACQIPAFHASPQARVTLLGLMVAAYNSAAALEFYRGQARTPLPSRPLVATLLVIVAVIYGICGLIGFFFPFSQTGAALPASPWLGLLISIGTILMAGATILLVALTKEQAELRSTTILTAARDAAAEVSEHKTRFLARMSHELRTPLNGMLGLAQVLANDPAQGEHQRRQAATLERAGRHLQAILNEVLDLASIEAGRLELVPRPLALAAFLEETLALVRGVAVAKGVALSLRGGSELSETVLADPMRLRQILLNLLSNALKFTPSEGSVTLAVARGADRMLRFAVTDTGPGVSAALRPRLFQDYMQERGETAADGSGLGLAISARLAAAMGGEVVHADNPDGAGSRFTLAVPLPVVTPAVVVPGVPLSLPPPGLRILVVDDIALNRLVAGLLLRQGGHVVEEVEDGPAALAAIARGPLPDVVLMDHSMPGMDGHAVAQRIRAMPGAAGRLPILAVTANALPEDIDASLAAGMDGHVAKPIDQKALLAAIAAALDRAALRQQGSGR
jgi:signal transduction histidine kinase/CheY-like chemotaxis protein